MILPEPFEHPELGAEEESVTGHSVFTKEERVRVGGRDVLVLFGAGVFDTSCCGAGGCAFAVVPGYLAEYRSGVSARGRPVSLVEPVERDEEREAVAAAVRAVVPNCQVRFGT